MAIEEQMETLVDRLLLDYDHGRDIDQMELFRNPDRDVVIGVLEKLRRILFPGYFRDRNYRFYNLKYNLSVLIEDVMFQLTRQVSLVFQRQGEKPDQAEQHAQQVCFAFLNGIPDIRAMVQTDLQAAYDGDPAATGMDEVIFSYPGLYAISVYRLAHELFRLGVPMIPRMMTEYAHSLTGIDIHPGATIGKYFFIDHGHGHRYRRDHHHRGQCEGLPGRDPGRPFHPWGPAAAGQEAPSDHRGQCDHLRRSLHSGGQHSHRGGQRHRLQRLYHQFHCTGDHREHQDPGIAVPLPGPRTRDAFWDCAL